MISLMRLYQHRETWYVYHKGTRWSLKTKDKRKAKGLFRKLQTDYLQKEARRIGQKSAVKLSEFLEFYNTAADRQDLSEHTPKNINSAFQSLIKYMGDLPISTITKDLVDRYKLDAQTELKPVTVNTYLIVLNAALAYAVKNGILVEAPRFSKIKTGKRLRRVISQGDIDKLLAEAGPDLQRAIKISLWTGARLSEVLNMRYEHKTGGSIRIIGKGDKERIVPLMGPAKEILSGQDIGRVITQWDVPRSMSYAFTKVAKKVGVKARFHDLRHTAATNMLAHGVNLAVVQRVLGHASITTTQIYADVLEETMMKEMQKMEETK